MAKKKACKKVTLNGQNADVYAKFQNPKNYGEHGLCIQSFKKDVIASIHSFLMDMDVHESIMMAKGEVQPPEVKVVDDRGTRFRVKVDHIVSEFCIYRDEDEFFDVCLGVTEGDISEWREKERFEAVTKIALAIKNYSTYIPEDTEIFKEAKELIDIAM